MITVEFIHTDTLNMIQISPFLGNGVFHMAVNFKNSQLYSPVSLTHPTPEGLSQSTVSKGMFAKA